MIRSSSYPAQPQHSTSLSVKSLAQRSLCAVIAVSLAACGGSASAPPATSGPSPTPSPTPSPAPSSSTCSIQNQISFANDVLNEWYLFPDLLDNSVDPTAFTTVQSYLNARVAPARAQSRDKGFTFATSIADENALINSGSSAGFGIRLAYDRSANRVFLFEAFENGPGFAAGMDRGTELTAIGTSSATLQSVTTLMATGGPQAVVNALGPADAGLTRVIRFTKADGSIVETSIAKTDFALDPISDRYGALILDDGGKKVGYLNLRTFIIADASRQLRDAFRLFNTNNVSELIVDLRYNGGGLVSVAEDFGDLLGKDRVGQVWSRTVLRASKSDRNSTELFENEVQALRADKIAFITTGASASASELVINSMLPYLDADKVALVGSNTSGKPVGQFGFDLAECDLRIRAVTFRTVNANDQGDYFNGLASVVPNTCRADDNIFRPLGDSQETSIATALDFLAGRSCTPMTTTSMARETQMTATQDTLEPNAPSAAQSEIPGFF